MRIFEYLIPLVSLYSKIKRLNTDRIKIREKGEKGLSLFALVTAVHVIILEVIVRKEGGKTVSEFDSLRPDESLHGVDDPR